MDKAAFDKLGWAKLPYDPKLAIWATETQPMALEATNDASHSANWLRCQSTWFVGVDVLTKTRPLTKAVQKAAQYAAAQDNFNWGKGQVSTCYKGYPKQDRQETDGMFAYRKKRDFAHLDGLKPVGSKRLRKMEEFHSFILGIPLNKTPVQAAPFVIWEGSHVIFHKMLMKIYKDIPVQKWPEVDITDAYQKTRAQIFETCKRVEVHANPGEAYIAHRFALHGMSAWNKDLNGPETGRMIAYFRPYWQTDLHEWAGL